MRVTLLRWRKYLAEIIYKTLDSMSFAFLGSLDDKDSADHLICSGDVQ